MNALKDLTMASDRLKRNESQMSEDQKKQYAPQLKALRRRISTLSYEVAQEYIVQGMKVLKEDADEYAKRIATLIKEEYASGVLVTAAKTLLETGSTEEFLRCLEYSQKRLWYEGYGPYWVSHCMPVDDSDRDTTFTYYNDLIDMFWSEEWRLWKKKGEAEVTIMLPPTMEQLNEEYEKELAKEDNHV